MDIIAEPLNNGDLHIRHLLEAPKSYLLDNAHVTEHFIEAFFTRLWDKDSEFHAKLQLVQFPGSHNETAFVEIRNEHQCIIEQVAPVFASRDGDKHKPSYWLNHLDAVTVRRTQLAKFFTDKVARNQQGVTVEKMITEMNHYGLYWLDTTGEYVAKDLPFYTVNLENE